MLATEKPKESPPCPSGEARVRKCVPVAPLKRCTRFSPLAPMRRSSTPSPSASGTPETERPKKPWFTGLGLVRVRRSRPEAPLKT
jgi:hypothetical protein